jgi:hypothetical protein
MPASKEWITIYNITPKTCEAIAKSGVEKE